MWYTIDKWKLATRLVLLCLLLLCWRIHFYKKKCSTWANKRCSELFAVLCVGEFVFLFFRFDNLFGLCVLVTKDTTDFKSAPGTTRFSICCTNIQKIQDETHIFNFQCCVSSHIASCKYILNFLFLISIDFIVAMTQPASGHGNHLHALPNRRVRTPITSTAIWNEIRINSNNLLKWKKKAVRGEKKWFKDQGYVHSALVDGME